MVALNGGGAIVAGGRGNGSATGATRSLMEIKMINASKKLSGRAGKTTTPANDVLFCLLSDCMVSCSEANSGCTDCNSSRKCNWKFNGIAERFKKKAMTFDDFAKSIRELREVGCQLK